MMKAKKGNTMILGLSELNITKLKLGQPIKFNMKELGFVDIDVLIFAAKDEEEMKRMFSPSFGPKTEVKDTTNVHKN